MVSDKSQHKLVQGALRIMAEYVFAAQELLVQDGDQCIEVLKLLAQARWAGQQGTAAIMAPCLDGKIGTVQAIRGDSADEELDQLIELASFFLLNLCPSCRQDIGRSLIGTRSEGSAMTVSTIIVSESEGKNAL